MDARFSRESMDPRYFFDFLGDVHFHPMLPRTARISLIVGR
jgi:hypothetical protein